MKKILAAVDGSEPSMIAARLGLELSKATGAPLTLVCSVAPVTMPGEVPFTVISDVQRSERKRAELVISTAIKALNSDGLKGEVLDGSPAEAIADLAEKDGYDLVVVGSRGRNAVARLFLGSVADRLVHICKKPVLVAR